jgi:hypothetical protein
MSVGGCRYACFIVCVDTRYAFVSFHKNKSDIAAWITQHFDHLVDEAGSPISVFRTDGGGEYRNQALDGLLAARGVLREFTATGSSFQNAHVERYIRTIRESSGACLSRSGLGDAFWAEAMAYAVFVRNRLPAAGDRPAPYHASKGQPPSLRLLHPFGCLAMVRVAAPRKSSLTTRSRPAVYLGPASVTKDAHRVLHLDTSSVAVSRNVTFFDDDFPLLRSDSPLAARAPELAEDRPTFKPTVPPPESRVGRNHFATTNPVHSLSGLGSRPPSSSRAPSARVSSRPAVYSDASYRAQREHDASVVQVLVSVDSPGTYVPDDFEPASAETKETEETPSTFKQALATPEADDWITAVRSELSSLKANGTYTPLEGGRLPHGRYPIPARFVFKIKRNSDGSVDRFKARLVAKGFMTRKGIDYHESFAPTLRTSTFRMLCAFACQNGFALHQMDVSTAFLVPCLDAEVFLTLPEFPLLSQHFADLLPGLANVRLDKALYGLVNSPRLWNLHLTTSLRDLGFDPSPADPCLYVRTVNGTVVAAIAVFVDDLAVAAPESDIAALKAQLSSKYKMTDGGSLSWFLSVHVLRDLDNGILSLDQETSIQRLLEDYNMTDCNAAATPAEPTVLQVGVDPLSEEESAFMADKPYRAVVGSLLYFLFTRPDIAYAVGQLSRFLSRPNRACWVAAMRVLRYLKGTASLKLTYEREEEKLHIIGFADADFAGDKSTRRSTSGFIFRACGGAITFKSKLQKAVTLSTCEAELVAFSAATQEAIWIKRVFASLGVAQTEPIGILEDNAAAIALVRDHRFSERTKHVDIKKFFIHEHVEDGSVNPIGTPSTDNVADIFTKPLGRVLFEKHRHSLGLR